MTKLTKLLTVLFSAFIYIATQAQTMVYQPVVPYPPNMEDENQYIDNTILTYSGDDIIAYMGDFNEIPDVPGSSNLFYIDSQDKVHIFPGTKNFGIVYIATMGYDGEILIGTDNGMYKLTGSNWLEMYETSGHAVRLVHGSTTGKLFFTREIPFANPDFAPVTQFLYVDGDGEHVLFETDGLATGYAELDTIGVVTFKTGGMGTLDPCFGFNLNTMQEIVDFQPPHESEWYKTTGGHYDGAMTANGKIYFSGGGPGSSTYLISWNGNNWAEDEFRFAGRLYVISDELYCGPYRVNAVTLNYETVATIGDEMAWGKICYFNDTWYILNTTLYPIQIGPATTSIDTFAWNISAYLPSNIARIGTATTIDQLAHDQITIFPNPVTTDAIHIEGMAFVNSVMLYDVSGKLIVHGNNMNTNTIDVKDVVSGIYYISLDTDVGKFNAPLIIQH